MTRTKPDTEKSLDKLAIEYIDAKNRETEAGKITKTLGPQIKDLMRQDNLESYDTSGGRLIVSKRVSESFDEDSLIKYLKSIKKASGIVRRKEYIDYDALESAIYNEKLNQDEVVKMDKFKIVKETEVLSIKH